MDLIANLRNSYRFAKKLLADPRCLVILIVLSFLSSRLTFILESTGLVVFPEVSFLSLGWFYVVAVGFVGLAIGWLVTGYYARTLRQSPSSEIPPPFDRPRDLFLDGAKIFFAGAIYLIIPAIFISAGGASFYLSMLGQTGTVESSPNFAFGGIGLALILIGFIMVIVFLIVLVVGIAHMVRTGKFAKAFAFREIFGIIGKIGWARYIAWLIMVGVISLIVIGVASAIPFIGWLFLSAVVSPFVGVFGVRSLAILYNDGAPPELRMAPPIVTEALVCPSCGTPLQPHEKFCPNCGTAAPAHPSPPPPPAAGETRFCISCGARIPTSARFCGTCGARQT